MTAGSPAKIPDTIGSSSFSAASFPRRRRPNSATLVSSPGGVVGAQIARRSGTPTACRAQEYSSRIGSDVVITQVGKPMDLDAPDQGYYIRDGVVVIPKNAIIPDGTWI